DFFLLRARLGLLRLREQLLAIGAYRDSGSRAKQTGLLIERRYFDIQPLRNEPELFVEFSAGRASRRQYAGDSTAFNRAGSHVVTERNAVYIFRGLIGNAANPFPELDLSGFVKLFQVGNGYRVARYP